jgi:hypothetical protein
MKPCHKTMSAALALLLVAAGCHRQPNVTPPGSNRVLPNGIYMVATGCDVDYPTVNLRRSLNHQVSWQSADGQQYAVVFQPALNPKPGTPFVDNHNQPVFSFTVPPNGHVNSSVPIIDGYFAYSVNDSNGKECKNATDPGVSIKP